MGYKLIRIDNKYDEVTSHHFDSYSDAYDFLEKLYGDYCCSDADFGNMSYYDIVEE